jgi:two-component system cell cycle sensor histidine kinase/response regulator CckA
MNACGAAPQTGNLLVCAENIDGRVPPSFDLPAGRYVRIEIEDNGTGIPEGIRNSRFEDRFPAKRPGLDLATVKSILQEHRGGITIKLSIAFSVPIFARQKGAVDLKHSTDSRGAFAKA